MHSCSCVFVRLCVFARVYACVSAPACVRVRSCLSVCACTCARECVCMRVRERVCVRAPRHASRLVPHRPCPTPPYISRSVRLCHCFCPSLPLFLSVSRALPPLPYTSRSLNPRFPPSIPCCPPFSLLPILSGQECTSSSSPAASAAPPMEAAAAAWRARSSASLRCARGAGDRPDTQNERREKHAITEGAVRVGEEGENEIEKVAARWR
jgi:hypothetical protein